MNTYTSLKTYRKSYIAANRSEDAAVQHSEALHGGHRAELRHPVSELEPGYERALHPARGAHATRDVVLDLSEMFLRIFCKVRQKGAAKSGVGRQHHYDHTTNVRAARR